MSFTSMRLYHGNDYSMSELMQVFMETLRLYPPISSLSKASPTGGTYLSGYFIPKGTFISVSKPDTVNGDLCINHPFTTNERN